MKTTLTALAFSLIALAPLQAQLSPSLATAITAEHNRVKKDPAAYAAELEKMKDGLVKSRVAGGEAKALAERAIDSAIKDLKAMAAKPAQPALVFSAGGSKSAETAAKTLNGNHSASPMTAAWKSGGDTVVRMATAESITSIPASGSDADKAKEIVRGLLVDWGSNNDGKYMHRCFIINYDSVSAPASVTMYKKTFKYIGLGAAGTMLYIQYGL